MKKCVQIFLFLFLLTACSRPETDPCENVAISFNPIMRFAGTISILQVSGGIPPYKYSLDNSPFQAEEYFLKKIYTSSHKISVKDSGGCIRSVQEEFPVITVAGGNGEGIASNQLNKPFHHFVDHNGVVYIADRYNCRVQRWAYGDTTGTTVGAAPLNYSGEMDGIFVDSSANIYVAMSNAGSILRFSPGSTTGTIVAGGNGYGNGSNQLNTPRQVFVRGGYMYIIADYKVVKWAIGAGSGTTLIQPAYGNSIYVDEAENIYIAEIGFHRITKWTRGATSGIVVAGGNGPGEAANQLNEPSDVFVDKDGNMYIADQLNDRIQKWAPGATSGITVAGDNSHVQVIQSLSFPSAVMVRNGYIYICDKFYNRIQRWKE